MSQKTRSMKETISDSKMKISGAVRFSTRKFEGLPRNRVQNACPTFRLTSNKHFIRVAPCSEAQRLDTRDGRGGL